MRFIIYITIIVVFYACGSKDIVVEGPGLREVFRYNAVDNAFLYMGNYDPLHIKNDSLLSSFDMQFDTANNTLIYFSDTLNIVDSIRYMVDGESYILGLFHYDITGSYDEECWIILKNHNPFVIFNYPWKEYLFLVSDSTDKRLMNMVVADNRLMKKL